MRRLLSFFFLLISISLTARAETRTLIYFGGGGDPPGPTTIFDGSFSAFTAFGQERKWQASVFYDGGHPESEKLARRQVGSSLQNFNSTNYDQKVKQTLEDLRSGKIVAGSQLMIILDTHGEPRGQDQIHSVESTDSPVSVDKLKALRDLAEQKGVKLAILDTSCYGGNSLKLAGPHTCVIGLSLPHRMATTEDTEALAAALRDPHNKTLEQAFLAGRKKTGDGAQPQISSPQGLLLQETLAEMDKTLYDYDDLEDQVDNAPWCRDVMINANSLPLLKQRILQFKKIMHEPDLAGLSAAQKERLHDLKIKMERYEKARAPLNHFLMFESNAQLCNQDQSYCLKLSEIDAQKEVVQEDMKTHPTRENRDLLSSIEKFQKEPAYQNWLQRKKRLQKNIDQVEAMLPGIARDERALYDDLYRQARTEGPNPCRDFKL